MRYLICAVLMLAYTSLFSQRQTDLRGDRIIANSGIFLKDSWLDSLQKSLLFLGNTRSVPTSDAVARFVKQKIDSIQIPNAIISVQSLTNRNAIPDSIRYEGLISYVKDSLKYYSLVGGVTNFSWQEFTGAGGGGGGGSVSTNEQSFTATAGQTQFTVSTFTVPADPTRTTVTRRGVVIAFAVSGNIITINPCIVGDIIKVKSIL